MKLNSALLLLVLALTGCSTISYQQATISATSVKNPSIGYNGYEFFVPQGFEVSTNLDRQKTDRAPTQFCKGYYRYQQTNGFLAHSPFSFGPVSFSEAFLLQKKEMSIVFIVFEDSRCPIIWSLMSPMRQRELLMLLTPQTLPTEHTSLRYIGDRIVWDLSGTLKFTGQDKQKHSIAHTRFCMFGDHKECFAIEGLAKPEDAEELAKTMVEIIQKLRL